MTNFRSSAQSWANWTWQTQNAIAASTSNKIPLYYSEHVGSAGHARVYGWFQSRSCAVGFWSWTCSGWYQHEIVMDLYVGWSSGFVVR